MVAPSIEDLQSQINLLRRQSEIPSNPASLNMDELRKAIREELTSLLGAAPVKELSLLEAIGLALSEDEQVWLSSNLQNVEAELPRFFQTQQGKEGVRAFLKYYKGTHGIQPD